MTQNFHRQANRTDCKEAMETEINGSQLKAMFIAGSTWLKAHVPHVNAMNVFPVPDGDTGVNMFLTLQGAIQALEGYGGNHAGQVASLASRGALMGARGNSGVILSQILEGISEAIREKETFSAVDLAQGLQRAADRAYNTVLNPVEGTILTIIREVAVIAQKLAAQCAQPSQLLEAMLETAKQTLQQTPEMLPVLKQAGVVDSGGQGLVYFIEGMLRQRLGLSIEQNTEIAIVVPNVTGTQVSEAHYDVQFLLQGDNLDQRAIEQTIAAMGECPLVVGGSGLIKVHVHVANPDVPLAYGRSLGTLSDVVVEDMAIQHQALQADMVAMGVVAVVPSPQFERIFTELGATGIVFGGQTMNPSAQDLLTAINATGAQTVFVLPNNRNIRLAAEQAAELAAQQVFIIATQTLPQGISALLAFDPDEDPTKLVQDMQTAVDDVLTIAITRAVRNSQIHNLDIKQGDYLALLNDTLTATAGDAVEVLHHALDLATLQSYSLATIFHGEAITSAEAVKVAAQLSNRHPHLETEVVFGGQPHYQYIISLE